MRLGLEKHFGMSLKEFKAFIDTQVFRKIASLFLS